MKPTAIYFNFILVFILISCSQEELQNLEYPRINTESVTEISGQGALLSAQVLTSGSNPILEYGFVWGKDEALNAAFSEKVVLKEGFNGSGFQYHVKSTLKEGDIYYVKAFVKTTDYVVYGNIVVFTSLGSKAPTIAYFEPINGVAGDTVYIFGKNFSYNLNTNKVFFGNDGAKVVSPTDSLIKVLLPSHLTNTQFKIRVEILGNVSESSDMFNIIPPFIEKVSPTYGNGGDTIMIEGSGFSTKKEYNHVNFNDKNAEVISASTNVLQIKLPYNLYNPVSLSVKTSNDPFVLENALEYSRLEIKEVSKTEIVWGDTVMLLLNNTISYDEVIDVKVGKEELISADVIDVDGKNLILFIPEEVNIKNNDIHVIVNEEVAKKENALIIKDCIIDRISPGYFFYGETISVHGKNFKKSGNKIKVLHYEVTPIYEADTLIKFVFPENISSYSVDFNNIPLVVETAQDIQATITAKLPGPEIHSILPEEIFNEGGQVMINGRYFYTSNLYVRYNYHYCNIIESTDSTILIEIDKSVLYNQDRTHTVKDNLDVYSNNRMIESKDSLIYNYTSYHTSLGEALIPKRHYSVGFSIGNKGYVTGGVGANGEELNDLWEFETETGAWTQKSDFPGAARLKGIAVSLNDQGYVGLGMSTGLEYYTDFWKYNPQSNSWDFVTEAPYNSGQKAFATIYDNKILIGAGTKPEDSAYSKVLSMYDPNSDQWKFVDSLEMNSPTGNYFSMGGIISGDYLYFIYNQIDNIEYNTKTVYFKRFHMLSKYWETLSYNIYNVRNSGHLIYTPFEIGGQMYLLREGLHGASVVKFDTFSGTYQQLGNSTSTAYGVPCFIVNDVLYYGIGKARTGNFQNYFWSFDPAYL